MLLAGRIACPGTIGRIACPGTVRIGSLRPQRQPAGARYPWPCVAPLLFVFLFVGLGLVFSCPGLGPGSLACFLDMAVFRQPATRKPPPPHPERFQPITYGSDQRPALARLARACRRSLAFRRACLASNTPRHHCNHTQKIRLNGRPPCIVSLCFGSCIHSSMA